MLSRSHRAMFQLALPCILVLVCDTVDSRAGEALPDLEAALAAKQDVWGLAAMSQPNGPGYEFFEKLLPPLRYVNAAFHYYPIVLSAPNAPVKARLVSNGSGLNARAAQNSWHEFYLPVRFMVGDGDEVLGEDLKRLDGPRYERGYLPVVHLRYQDKSGRVYLEEAFAAVEPALANRGLVLVRFQMAGGGHGTVGVQLDAPGPWTVSGDTVWGPNAGPAAGYDRSWSWDAAARRLTARLGGKRGVTLAFATRPAAAAAPGRAGDVQPGRVAADVRRRAGDDQPDFHLLTSSSGYAKQRTLCLDTWQSLLDGGTRIEVPEARVNDAWRALVVSLFALVNGDRLNYSAGNGYDRQYEAECGDAVRALLLFGQAEEARRTLLPLLDYVQEGVRYHDAAFKLQMLAHYFWLTRDTNLIAAARPQWERELRRVIEGRETTNGLLPRENYCGDIPTQVYSLNSSANAWRGLRDFAAVLDAAGDVSTARPLRETAASFRRCILAAVEKSERRDVEPPFIPVALFGEEQPYDMLTATQLGGYWCLMAPYILGSGVFGPGAERERAIVNYLQEHGGVAMGMIRFDMHTGLYANADALDDLYGLRYTIKLLELDDVDRALAGFYGKLAQGLTRDTFVGAEGTGLRPTDAGGRPMCLPPNSSSQASFLWMLRCLLVQDWDLNDDGQPETLRLAGATPRRWLEDGKIINVERAPTAFGQVSMRITSRLRRGEVVAELDLPKRNPATRTLLRIRVPEGWRVTSAKAGRAELTVDERGTVDLSRFSGRQTIHFRVAKS